MFLGVFGLFCLINIYIYIYIYIKIYILIKAAAAATLARWNILSYSEVGRQITQTNSFYSTCFEYASAEEGCTCKCFIVHALLASFSMKRTKIYFFTGNQQTSPRCVLCFLISSLPIFFIFINVDLNLSTLVFLVSQCCLFSGNGTHHPTHLY